MLVLTRKPDEQIRIGDDIVITIVRVKGNTIRVGVEAPKGVRVIRGELEGKPKTGAPASETHEIRLSEQEQSVSAQATPAAAGAGHKGQSRRLSVAPVRADRGVERSTEQDRGLQGSSPLGSYVLAARIPLSNSANHLNSRVG
jgi:carbon storage regulator CsrA